MAFYHTHRPQQFGDLIGQDHIRTTFLNALKNNQIGHAYLFAGPRGLGKTTSARLLAKALNCTKQKNGEPCNKCESCVSINNNQALDVLEIDGASNRGIDEIRELRELVKFPPQILTKKVIIIDEVHMLTKEAFNALLKTLEEPPPHVIFILATTEAHKVQPTILSRVQRFDFHTADRPTLQKHIKNIARAEKITIDPEAIDIISQLAEGSFRDGVSLLDQINSAVNDQKITASLVENILGLPSHELMDRFYSGLASDKREMAFLAIDEFVENGGDPSGFTNQAIAIARMKLRGGEPKAEVWLEGLFQVLEQQKYSPIPTLPLELFVAEQTKNKHSIEIVKKSPLPIIKRNDSQLNEELWHNLIEQLKSENASLAAILKDSHLLESSEKEIKLAVKFKFHQDKICDSKNLPLVENLLEKISGKKLKVVCIVDSNFVRERESQEKDDLVKTALEIFEEENG